MKIFLYLFVFILYSATAIADTPAAKVGSRIITIEELKKTINSTPYALPNSKIAPPSHKALVMEILNGIIDAELLYSDAINSKIDSSPKFTREASSYRKSLLANMYRKWLLKKITVDDKTLKQFAKEKRLNEEAARAILINDMQRMALEKESARLFDKYNVKFMANIATTDMQAFTDNDILVISTAFKIYFKDIRQPVAEAGYTKISLMNILTQSVEQELLAAEAVEAGLDKEKHFQDSVYENEHILTVVIHRENLEKNFSAGEDDVKNFIKNNDYLQFEPQTAEVLMIVVKTETEAKAIRERSLKEESFYRLATDYSISPNSAQNAGRIPPLKIGDHPYTVIKTTISGLKPDGVTMPIKGDKGYSIFKLLSITPRKPRPAVETKTLVSQIIREQRIQEYLQKLRKGKDVIIYPAVNDL